MHDIDHSESDGTILDVVARLDEYPDSYCAAKAAGQRRQVKGRGYLISIAIAAAAVFALTHTFKNVDYNEVFEVVRSTNAGLIALAGCWWPPPTAA